MQSLPLGALSLGSISKVPGLSPGLSVVSATDPLGEIITLTTSDAVEITVDKGLLASSSRFWSDMLSTCDTGRITLDETHDSIELLLQVLNNEPQPSTFNTADKSCWEVYKKVLVVADKYDMPVVRERVEKWLVSRCLRGKTRCQDFKFQDVRMGQEWLSLCSKYSLKCLGWFVAYDLGSQLVAKDGGWGVQVSELLAGINDPELLKTMLEAVSDNCGGARLPPSTA